MKNFSSTYLAVIVAVLLELFKFTGIDVGSEELTITVTTILQVLAGVWVLVERFKKGGINFLGVKK